MMIRYLFFLIFVIFFSCGSEKPNDQHLATRETINLNFTSNILNLDSGEVHTEAENFVLSIKQNEKAAYSISKLDDDILCELQTSDSTKIKNINIRFLKNEEAILNQFLEGNLDIINVKTYDSLNSNYNFLIKQIQNDPYSNYQLTKGNHAKIKVLKLSSFSRLNELSHVLDLLSIDKRLIYLDTSTVKMDSIGIYPLSISTSDSLLTKHQDSLITWSSTELLTTNSPHIDSEYIIIDYMNDNLQEIAQSLHQNDSSTIGQLNATIVVEIYPEYYITSNSLKGLKDYKKLSDLIPELFFDTIRSY